MRYTDMQATKFPEGREQLLASRPYREERGRSILVLFFNDEFIFRKVREVFVVRPTNRKKYGTRPF